MKFLLLAVTILFSGHSFAATVEKSKFPFDYSPDKQSTVQIINEKGTIKAKYKTGKAQSLLEEWDETIVSEFNNHVALEEDFNFDGFKDLAIYESTGYGGVNQFYQLYFWNKKTQQLDQTTLSVSNPEISEETLLSSQRSGPVWYSTYYRFSKGKPYKYWDTKIIGDGIMHGTVFNVSGKKIFSGIYTEDSKNPDDNTPVTAEILIDKAWLYKEANDASKTGMYVIKGDEVTLLDYSGDLGDAWFLARYEGKKTITKWIKGEAIQ